MNFSFVDIVVYCGVICSFGSIKHFITEQDDIRLATEEEVKRYYDHFYKI